MQLPFDKIYGMKGQRFVDIVSVNPGYAVGLTASILYECKGKLPKPQKKKMTATGKSYDWIMRIAFAK